MAEQNLVRQDRKRYLDVNNEPDKALPPLLLVSSKQTVLPLREAVKPIQHLVEDLPNKVSYSLEKCKNPKDDLTRDESAALYLYSLQWPEGKPSFYTMFNRSLRDEDRAKLVPYHDYLNLFMSAFKKLPSVQDRVWRGVNGDLSAKYRPDTTHVWWGVSSCTNMVQVISQSNPAPNFHIVDIEQIAPSSKEVTETASAGAPGIMPNSVQQRLGFIWLDSNIHKTKDNIKAQTKLRELLRNNFETFEDADKCEAFVRHYKNRRLVLIVGGQIGRQVVPNVHNLPQLISIIVYCMNQAENEKWTKNHEKVESVLIHSSELINEVEKVLQKENEDTESNMLSKDILDYPQQILTPIDGYQNSPLMPIDKALQPLNDIIPDLTQQIWIARQGAHYEGPLT
ncbi:unnamed protein product, partial [Didymodactylos carnosus]